MDRPSHLKGFLVWRTHPIFLNQSSIRKSKRLTGFPHKSQAIDSWCYAKNSLRVGTSSLAMSSLSEYQCKHPRRGVPTTRTTQAGVPTERKRKENSPSMHMTWHKINVTENKRYIHTCQNALFNTARANITIHTTPMPKCISTYKRRPGTKS